MVLHTRGLISEHCCAQTWQYNAQSIQCHARAISHLLILHPGGPRAQQPSQCRATQKPLASAQPSCRLQCSEIQAALRARIHTRGTPGLLANAEQLQSCWVCWKRLRDTSIFLQCSQHPGKNRAPKEEEEGRGRKRAVLQIVCAKGEEQRGKSKIICWSLNQRCNPTLAVHCHQQHYLQAASIQQLRPKINSAGFPGCLLGFSLSVFLLASSV